MRLLHWILRGLLRRVEEAMIRRLLHQRDDAWSGVDIDTRDNEVSVLGHCDAVTVAAVLTHHLAARKAGA